eukprot:TRINITY_DN2028_c0_g1_i1.p1 TRINITY_DN2028_c0_g1~~TRINITY_DN2028_c0_g1_i1.p1  ORF type:complete len:367 (+),score=53.81 TRINITY_DN2028_c0_g1_i1:154-1101(+)
MSCSGYQQPGSCLGRAGPLSEWGPLGMLGSIGDYFWNPSTLFKAIGDWSNWQKYMTESGGVLSGLGPLGPKGPLSEKNYNSMRELAISTNNDFVAQMFAGGVFGVLGPLGPLGPLGVLGPLGPTGAHGYASDSKGRYLHKDEEVRTIKAAGPEGVETTFDLFEKYSGSYAQGLDHDENDCSWMAIGSMWAFIGSDDYKFHSDVEQWVTIVVVPHYQADVWHLTVNVDGKNIESASNLYVNWVQVKVPAGAKIKATVFLAMSMNPMFKEYRIMVIGSQRLQKLLPTPCSGGHQIPLQEREEIYVVSDVKKQPQNSN